MSTAGSVHGELGQLLRDMRRRAGLSQEELAHRAGVSVRALVDMEQGHTRGPQRRTVAALAEVLTRDKAQAEALERAAAPGRTRPRRSPAARPGLLLPRDMRDFTAREADLARLRAVAEEGPAPVALITGQPGLGKTAFAVRAAHGLADRYPDGQFSVDLRGTHAEPATLREVLGRLLHACGTAVSALPQATEDRADLFRRVAGERRMLLLLDDAANEEQVRPLLPAYGPSLTLVTGRSTLAGLEGVHRITLGMLRREEAVALLARVVGPERVAAEAQAARDLADLCGGLPLAVRIAAQRLAAQPQERLAKLAALLADESRRLDALRVGDLQVRAAFALSYARLDPAARRMLRRATLAAGPDFSPRTVALLADTTLRQAELCTRELADHGLLQPAPAAERYRFHDLLRLFAAEQLAEDDPAELARVREATARWTLARAEAAACHFDPERAPTGDPDPVTAPRGPERARSWLEEERAQWLDSLHRASECGHHRQVLDTAEAMHWFSDRVQHWEQWPEVFRRSVAAARAVGSRREEAVHLNYLAWSYNLCLHAPARGLATARQALAVAREVGDVLQIGWAYGYGAGSLNRLGRAEEAVAWLERSAAHHRRNPAPQARLAELTTLNSLGAYLRSLGRPEEALAIHRRSEELCLAGISGQSADLLNLYRAGTLHHLGQDLGALDRWTEAEPLLRRALDGLEAAGMAAWSEPARLDLAITLRRLGREAEARTVLEEARRGLAEQGHPPPGGGRPGTGRSRPRPSLTTPRPAAPVWNATRSAPGPRPPRCRPGDGTSPRCGPPGAGALDAVRAEYNGIPNCPCVNFPHLKSSSTPWRSTGGGGSLFPQVTQRPDRKSPMNTGYIVNKLSKSAFRFGTLAVAAVASVALSSGTASAIDIEKDQAVYTTASPNYTGAGWWFQKSGHGSGPALAAFNSNGDYWYLIDTLADGKAAAVRWKNYRNGQLYRQGVCIQSHGAGTAGICNKNYYEDSTLYAETCLYDGDTKKYSDCNQMGFPFRVSDGKTV